MVLFEKFNLRHPRYSLLVYPYMFGQYRLMITDKTDRDPYAPPGHGSIVRAC